MTYNPKDKIYIKDYYVRDNSLLSNVGTIVSTVYKYKSLYYCCALGENLNLATVEIPHWAVESLQAATSERKHEHYDAIIAWAEGKPIYKRRKGTFAAWRRCDDNNPGFSATCDYREASKLTKLVNIRGDLLELTIEEVEDLRKQLEEY